MAAAKGLLTLDYLSENGGCRAIFAGNLFSKKQQMAAAGGAATVLAASGLMHLIQILLPVADNDGEPFPAQQFAALKQELLEGFGGVTVFSQGPAEGFWQGQNGTSEDEIVIFEVMAETVDDNWWRDLRVRLEADFRQDDVVIRAHDIRRL